MSAVVAAGRCSNSGESRRAIRMSAVRSSGDWGPPADTMRDSAPRCRSRSPRRRWLPRWCHYRPRWCCKSCRECSRNRTGQRNSGPMPGSSMSSGSRHPSSPSCRRSRCRWCKPGALSRTTPAPRSRAEFLFLSSCTPPPDRCRCRMCRISGCGSAFRHCGSFSSQTKPPSPGCRSRRTASPARTGIAPPHTSRYPPCTTAATAFDSQPSTLPNPPRTRMPACSCHIIAFAARSGTALPRSFPSRPYTSVRCASAGLPSRRPRSPRLRSRACRQASVSDRTWSATRSNSGSTSRSRTRAGTRGRSWAARCKNVLGRDTAECPVCTFGSWPTASKAAATHRCRCRRTSRLGQPLRRWRPSPYPSEKWEYRRRRS